MQTTEGARIQPQPEAQWTDEVRELLTKGTPDGRPRPSSFLQTMAWHPRLYQRWAPFAGTLLARGLLVDRDRELVALRCTWLTECGYEWAEHVKIAVAAGFTHDDIEAVVVGASDARWAPDDAAVLTAVDELRADGRLSDMTWSTLSSRLSEPQLIELLVLIGQYHLVPWVINTLRCELPNGSPGLDAR